MAPSRIGGGFRAFPSEGGFSFDRGAGGRRGARVLRNENLGAEPWAVDPPDDLRRSARVVLLGHKTAVELFEDADPLGQRLFINRVPFEIIGVLEERGPGLDATDEDGQVYVPSDVGYAAAAERRSLHRHPVRGARTRSDADRSEKAMTQLMRVRHRSSAARPDDFQVQSQRELIRTQIAAADRLQFLVSWIGLSAIFVSGLGILAIAWIAVRDRTREIGTRRALGATADDVFFQFAFEASVLAIAGIAIGVVHRLDGKPVRRYARAGLAFSYSMFAMPLSRWLLPSRLNLLFAGWPAMRAAKLDPIVALRHE